MSKLIDAVLFNPLILGFVIIIAAIFVFAVRSFFVESKKQEKSRIFVQVAPNMIVSIGILGTFTGVLIGLLEFDITLLTLVLQIS